MALVLKGTYDPRTPIERMRLIDLQKEMTKRGLDYRVPEGIDPGRRNMTKDECVNALRSPFAPQPVSRPLTGKIQYEHYNWQGLKALAAERGIEAKLTWKLEDYLAALKAQDDQSNPLTAVA